MSLVATVLDRLGLAADTFGDDEHDARAAVDQAVIDLLQLATLVDGANSEVERVLVREFVGSRRWADRSSPFVYAEESLARARHALSPGGPLDNFLRGVTDRLPTDRDRIAAYDAVLQLVGADGGVHEKEADLVAALRRRFEEAHG